MFRFTIRDVLWLTLVVSLLASLAIMFREYEDARNENKILKIANRTLGERVDYLMTRFFGPQPKPARPPGAPPIATIDDPTAASEPRP
jgi:hypothetical protein